MADTIQHSDNNRGATTVVVTTPSTETGTVNQANDKRESRFHFDGLQLNVWYFRSVPGVLKVIQWVIGIVCIACSSPPHIGAAHWFLFVSVFCFVVTFIWACIHFFSITSVLNLPWLLIEWGYTFLAMLLYFTAFIIMLVETAKTRYMYPWFVTFSYDAYMTAGAFGVINFIAYAIEWLYHGKTYLESRRSST